MTDRVVDAAVARLDSLCEWPWERVLEPEDAAAIRLVRDALIDARQEVAAQVQETTREQKWCRAVASRLEEAERQLAKQAQEVTQLKAELRDHAQYVDESQQEIAQLKAAQK